MKKFSEIQKKSTPVYLSKHNFTGLTNDISKKNNNDTLNTVSKLIKLQSLLEYSTKTSLKSFNIFPTFKNLESTNKRSFNFEKSKNLPVNLLFSIDQFLFEFSKKTYQQQKTGEFFQQLKERKKFSLFYGHLNQKQIRKFFQKVEKRKGYFSKILFSLLERKLDNALYRTGLTRTIKEAQQLIKHEKILVNSAPVTFPNYLLTPGDIISLNSKTAEILSNKLMTLVENQKIEHHPKIFEDFYSKFQKIIEKTKKKKAQVFQSKIFCDFLVQYLCIQIQSRSFTSKICLDSLKIKQTTLNSAIFKAKTSLMLVKSKFVSSNVKIEYKNTSIWNGNSFNLKLKPPVSFKPLNLRKLQILNNSQSLQFDTLLIFRKSFLIFCKNLEETQKFTNLILLNLKKFLFKKDKQNTLLKKKLHFREIKSIHYEISYNLLNIIYLYSPQRINFPFFIDLDLIKRSFC